MVRLILRVVLLCCSFELFAQASDDDWQEEQISSPTQWLEQLASPATRWVERQIQSSSETPDINKIALPNNVPADLLPPAEAARLLLSLFPGEILSLQYRAEKPEVYLLKHLSDSGVVTLYFLDAHNGILLDQLPAIIEKPAPLAEESALPATSSNSNSHPPAEAQPTAEQGADQ